MRYDNTLQLLASSQSIPFQYQSICQVIILCFEEDPYVHWMPSGQVKINVNWEENFHENWTFVTLQQILALKKECHMELKHKVKKKRKVQQSLTIFYVGFVVLRALGMKSSIFWDIITPCSLLKVNRCFGGTFRLHLQNWRTSQARNQHDTGSKQSYLLPASCWFLAWLILQSWKWRRNVPPKHELTFIGLHIPRHILFIFS
jgi:hypothetical protein